MGLTQAVLHRGILSPMALTGKRLRELRTEELRALRVAHLSPGRRLAASRRRAGSHLHLLLAGAWFVFLPVAHALEPAPSTAGTEPAWSALLSGVVLVLLAITAMGLVRRRRVGLVGSAAAAGLFLFASVMCPVSGHHVSVGPWWFAQMAGFLALGAVSVAGLRASRSPSSPLGS